MPQKTSVKGNIVTLSDYNVFYAAMIGVCRHICVIEREGRLKQNTALQGWQNHIDGALGEMVLAKWLGVFYEGSINTFTTMPDVEDYEVKTTAWADGKLIIPPYEKDKERKYVLVVTAAAPEFKLAGWVTAARGMNEKWLYPLRKEREPTFNVPQGELFAMSDLKNG